MLLTPIGLSKYLAFRKRKPILSTLNRTILAASLLTYLEAELKK